MEACLGTAALYTSPDFKTWTSAGAWTNQVRNWRNWRLLLMLHISTIYACASKFMICSLISCSWPVPSTLCTIFHFILLWTCLQVLLGQAQNGQCSPPTAPQPGNGVCDQFGSSCRMWECPDAFDMGNGTWAFKWSDQVSSLLTRPVCSAGGWSHIRIAGFRMQ